MRFLIFSRQLAEKQDVVNANCNVPHVWISIRNHHTTLANLPPCPFRKDSLFLEFDDIVPDGSKEDVYLDWQGNPPKPMTDDQAKAVIAFVKKSLPDISLICVNCEAGQSRSAAVALVLSQLINGDDSGILGNPDYSPNNHVRDLILKNGKPLANENTPNWYYSLWE
jgi:predicted protein tyrosine phosphatase